MGLYNFQKRFVPFIESGAKRHTIRARRQRRPKVDETLHLYTGLRQKGARLLMRVPCTRVERIEIIEAEPVPEVLIDGMSLSADECEQLARCDGFADFAEMMGFWKGRLPFVGDVIHWKHREGTK